MKGRNPTAEEKRWMNRVGEINCIICKNLHLGESPASLHHIDGRTKKGAHFKVIPLCGEHHQTGGRGIAIHPYKAEWEKRYGTQLELLEQVKMILQN